MKRFNPDLYLDSLYAMKECDDGDYVFYDDYAALQAKYERLVSSVIESLETLNKIKVNNDFELADAANLGAAMGFLYGACPEALAESEGE